MPDSRASNLSATRIVAGYCVLATLWVAFSDAVVTHFGLHPALMTLKGVAFVAVTAFLLNLTIRRLVNTIQAERAQWQGVVEGIAEEVWVCDARGKMTLVNLRSATEMGLPAFEGKSIQEVLEDVDISYPDGTPRPAEEAPLYRSLRGEIVRGEETMRHRRTGVVRHRQFSSAPTHDASGNITGAVAIVRDVTDMKHAQDALRRSEERLRVAALAAEIGVWYWTPGTDYVEVSANWRRLFGVAPDVEVTFATWREALHPDDRDRAARELNAASAEHRDFSIEYRAVHPDGTIRWLIDRGQAFYGENGRPTAMAGVNVDITERKQAEEASRASEAQLRTIVENMTERVYVCDREGNPLLTNEAFRSFYPTPESPLGYSEMSAEVEAFDLDGRPVPFSEWPIPRALRGERVRGLELRVRYRRSGREAINRYNAGPVVDSSGNVCMAVITSEDVTQRKQAEQVLIRSEKLAATGRLAATIAHEVNNPLAAAVNAVYLARNDPTLRPETCEALVIADQELRRAAHITQQTLGFYRDNGSRMPVALPKLIEEVLRLYARKLNDRRITVRQQFKCGPCREGCETCFYVNSGEMRQVISNLLGNGMDALSDGGSLHIRVSRMKSFQEKGPAIQITMADNGCGIRAENVKRIFEPFFTTKQSVGTGLGLWVTQELVRKHNGAIKVRSQAGKGTVFRILIPAMPSTAANFVNLEQERTGT